jgi:hypothetical protein
MSHDYHGKIRYVTGLLGERDLTTLFYVVAGWLLFNILFALAMYFRPVRKSSVDSEGHHVSEAGANASPPKRNKPPASWSRILLFGFWLNDGRHSA